MSAFLINVLIACRNKITNLLKGASLYFLLKRSALVITDTELKLMAVAAIIGLSKIPKKG